MASTRASDKSITLPLSEILRELVSVIGKKLTAHAGSTKYVGAIDGWIAGDWIDVDVEQRLRFAHRIVTILCVHDKPAVVQAWLLGVNPDLGDRTALRMLREDPLDVAGPLLLAAAASFVAGG